jgi:hypothetical protein
MNYEVVLGNKATSQFSIHYSQFIIEKPGFFLSKHWLEIGQKPGFWGTA